jgi:hypothetical protein
MATASFATAKKTAAAATVPAPSPAARPPAGNKVATEAQQQQAAAEAAAEPFAPAPVYAAFIVEDKGGDRIPPVEPGVYQAVCVGLFDCGTDEGGQYGPKRKMVLVWELPQATIDIERDGETVTLPRNISQRYTMSMNEKARLRQDVEAIRCKRLTKEEAKAFDVSCILGMNAQIQVTNVEKDGKTYANIETVMACPKGAAKLAPSVDPALFHFSAVEAADESLIPASCPRWVKKIIMASPEWAERGGEPMKDERE